MHATMSDLLLNKILLLQEKDWPSQETRRKEKEEDSRKEMARNVGL